MNEKILGLRNFSLRVAVLIFFGGTLVVGLFNIIGGSSLALTGLVTAITGSILYVTFAVRAIDNDKKAIDTSYLFIAGYCISIISSFKNLGETPNFSMMIINDVLTGEDSINAWAYQLVSSAAPFAFLMNVLILVGFFYSVNSVNKKFVGAWWISISAHIIAIIANLIVLAHGEYGTFQTWNNISGILGFLMLIVLLCIGGKPKKPVVPMVSTPIVNNDNIVIANEDTTPIVNEYKTPVSNSVQPPALPIENNRDKYKNLLRLKELYDAGILTETEFAEEKQKILNN